MSQNQTPRWMKNEPSSLDLLSEGRLMFWSGAPRRCAGVSPRPLAEQSDRE
jgi:hypothetical protein